MCVEYSVSMVHVMISTFHNSPIRQLPYRFLHVLSVKDKFKKITCHGSHSKFVEVELAPLLSYARKTLSQQGNLQDVLV